MTEMTNVYHLALLPDIDEGAFVQQESFLLADEVVYIPCPEVP